MGLQQDGTWTLIDPVTKETISAEPKLDRVRQAASWIPWASR